MRLDRLIHDRPEAELTDEELDKHMDRSHDCDSGERGLNWNTNPPSLRRSSALLTHASLHKHGVWNEVPHFHGGTMPFGAAHNEVNPTNDGRA
jgi:hypothetical protein